MLTQDYLKELFDYKDGHLYWKSQRNTRTLAGDCAGCVGKGGYRVIGINKKYYKAHRLIFFMFNNYWPKMVDHINGNKDDNRIENLRASDQYSNQWNRGLPVNNTSGVRGVYWNKGQKKWHTYCWVKGVNHYLGSFDDLAEAKRVREEFTKQHHQQYARQEW